jgi:hypothetical protein
MLQLNSNTGSNVIAVIPNITGSYSGSILVEFIYDYTWASSSIVPATVITNNNYLIMDITGSNLPTASGLYTVNFFSGSLSNDLTWSTWTPTWTTLTSLWPSYSGSVIIVTGSLIDTERAWVSGSNDPNIIQYLSQSQSTFKVYNK